ncbi:hypothetical protein RclHR1_00870007 [Rhizophagus clarus]|uniref:Stc1 domain-containing protein n=1 Tax=Rhizophagus clarus TaxID=94130 RepID=A0A2Z6S1X0_9GLOM|nr:hypothetical protein RclHR1_00870007 [Rhizophagus clarus]
MNNGGGNHCCTCLKPIKYKDAYNNQSLRKLKCKSCFENKRPLTPGSEDDRKRTRIETPEDPLESMVLDPKPQNKGKNKIPKMKCLECEREERTMNSINKLGICQKCDNKRIALERYVCDQECNDIMTIIHRTRKDKSGKSFDQIINDKIKIMVANHENLDSEEDDYEIESQFLKEWEELNAFILQESDSRICEQEDELKALRQEIEKIKSELELEKTINNFVDQYIFPKIETTSMEVENW